MHVKFEDTMTKWPEQNKNTQNTKNTKTQQTFRKILFMFFGSFHLLFIRNVRVIGTFDRHLKNRFIITFMYFSSLAL